MPISNNIVSVEFKQDPQLSVLTSSIQDGKYNVYSTDDANGAQETVVFKNPNSTTQYVDKLGFDGTVEQIKEHSGDGNIVVNFTPLSEMPKNHSLSGLTAIENSAVQDLASAAPNKTVDFATLDKTINLQTENFENVSGLFNAGLDKFKLPANPLVVGIKDTVKNAKEAIGNLLGGEKVGPTVDVVTSDQVKDLKKNATKISKTEEYMVKLEQWNQNPTEKLTIWDPDLRKHDLTEFASIVFTVMPIVDENRSASYDSLTPTHHPGSIQAYKTTSSRTFNINGKFISRSIDEANRTLKYLNTIRSWVMPYYGSGTAESYTNKIGLPPEILRFNAYGDKNLKDIPVVLTNYSWTYPEDVDYVQAIDADNKSYPVPRVIEISLSIMESYAPNELSKFDLLAYKNGDLNKAYGR